MAVAPYLSINVIYLPISAPWKEEAGRAQRQAEQLAESRPSRPPCSATAWPAPHTPHKFNRLISNRLKGEKGYCRQAPEDRLEQTLC